MTLEILVLFVLLLGMVYLFMTERIPLDLTAFLGLVALTLTGYIGAGEAFMGFASPAVITMLSVFIVGAGLLHTGVADAIATRTHSLVGNREVPLIVVLMLVAGGLSAFMPNIAATAVLMPAVASLSRRAGLSASRVFMPLAFATGLGGTMTLVGRPCNILASTMLEERGLEPFSLFEFTPPGIVLLVAGLLYMVTLGRKLLPVRARAERGAPSKDLAEVYELREHIFSIRIPEDSDLKDVTLSESRLAPALGVQVVSILRRGRERIIPEADTVLRSGDVLLIEGAMSDLKELLSIQGARVQQTRAEELPHLGKGVGGIRAGLAETSSVVGQSLRDVRFRERFGVVVVAIRRGDRLILEQLGRQVLRKDDEVLALGARPQLEALSSNPDFVVHDIGFSAVKDLENNLFLIRIPDGSSLDGRTVRASRLGELMGLTVAGLVREGQTRLAILPEEVLRSGDNLVVVGRPWRVLSLLKVGDVHFDTGVGPLVADTEEVGIAEAAVAPRSAVAGRTLEDLSFRDRYGLQVLALWREGKVMHRDLARQVLRFGDALLLQGDWDKVRRLAGDPDFLVLSETPRVRRKTRRAPVALGGLALMIALVVSGFQPIHVAAFTAASLVLLGGALSMEEAYRTIEWRAIFLVAATLPIGVALERTGATLLLAGTVTDLAGPFGPALVLAVLVIVTSLLSQSLDSAPAVVLMAPVVIEVASRLGTDPRSMMMGVALAASAGFMTPFSHKPNLLVMAAGGYRVLDYVRVGTPLTVLFILILVVLVPILFPF
jgi:di/tricarboxylate transporter